MNKNGQWDLAQGVLKSYNKIRLMLILLTIKEETIHESIKISLK